MIFLSRVYGVQIEFKNKTKKKTSTFVLLPIEIFIARYFCVSMI